jgi:hypothetical protein
MSASHEEPTEEQLRAAYEEEIKRLRVEHVLIESVVTLINLGMRRAGVVAGTEGERDPDQLQIAIEAVRAQLPLLERVSPDQVGRIRDALSQLQLAYVQIGGAPATEGAGAPGADQTQPSAATAPGGSPTGTAPATPPEPGGADQQEPIKPGEPGPAQRSGRLWVPGQ